jgi:hypothetical protein
MRGNAKVAGLLVVALVATSACGGDSGVKQVSSDSSGTTGASSSAATTPGSTVASGAAAEIDAMAIARTNEVLAMTQPEREAALVDAGMELELDAAHESGLEEALGGREATKAALEAAWAPVQGQALALNSSSLTLGLRRRTTAGPEIGEGMFGGYMTIALLSESGVTEEIPAGPPVSTDTGSGVVISGTQNSITVSGNFTHTDTKTGVTTKLETQSTVVPCPDANGSFDVSGLLDVTVTKGDAGQHGTLDVQVTGQIDDDAHLVSSDLEYQMQWSKSSGGSSQFVDVSVKIPASGDVVSAVNRTGGANTAKLEESAMVTGMMFAMLMREFLLRAAQKGWESGKCVRLDVTPSPAPKDMEPSSTADITAAPRSKMDGGPTGGTVMATLIDGGSGVEPSVTRLPADASFVYTAHPEPLNHGTVRLEARSKRGVGKAELTFETRGRASFQIVGGLDDFQVDEAVCDVMKPFQLSGGGFTASFSGGLTGTYSYVGPFDATGGGTYTISLPDGPLQPGTMVGQGSGSVTTPLGVFENTGTENYTLTPITGCIE